MRGGHISAARAERAVSLLELLVVVAVLGIIAAILAPPLLMALRSSREGRAIANLKTIASAQMILFGSKRRFGVFDELIRTGDLPDQFERGAKPGGPRGSGSEAVADSVYLYSIRYTRDADGITIDADPKPGYASSHRRFRMRLGRAASGASGGEGVLLVAEPSASSPPSSAYRPLGGGR